MRCCLQTCFHLKQRSQKGPEVNHRKLYITAFLVTISILNSVQGDELSLQIESVRQIWAQSERQPGVVDSYSAFTDLVFLNGYYYVTFRESDRHVYGRNGRIAVIRSKDRENWQRVADFRNDIYDLRDSKFAIDAQGKMAVWFTGADYKDKYLQGRKTWIAFWDDSKSAFGPVTETIPDTGSNYQEFNSEWPWALTWHNGKAFTASYRWVSSSNNRDNWLFSSADGIKYKPVVKLEAPILMCEMALRFSENDNIVCFGRSRDKDLAYIGWATRAENYTNWTWKPLKDKDGTHRRIGGPNFLILDNGRMIASGRQYEKTSSGRPMTGIFEITRDGLWTDTIELPSGGDNGYPGLHIDGNKLYMSYYSKHQKGPHIYFAVINGNFNNSSAAN